MSDVCKLMGILNCTPNSFVESSRFPDPMAAIQRGLRLIEEGADIIDVGGESTRPHSKTISEQEEIKRVLPVIEGILQNGPFPISIDTYKPRVAELALKAGATFINDITGFVHPEMRQLAADHGVLICVMHMLGPVHTQPRPVYPRGVITEIYDFFQMRVETLLRTGVLESQIILDPGIGGGAFGKTPEQNLLILKHLRRFSSLGFPILIGLSRKSFMPKILRESPFQKRPLEILSTTIALNTMSILEGVDYIRVHDVQEHRDVLTLLGRLR